MKAIKFIGILAAASFLFSFNAYAQEDANRGADGEVVRGPYVTNGAFDNMFIGLGAGVNSVIEKSFGLGKIGIATDVTIGKWFSPTIGLRAGWQGINNTSKSGEFNKAPFHYIHGDLLWNISNAIDGYKETRFWNFIPYVSGGLSMIKHHGLKEFDQELAAGVGLLNCLRLGERVNLNLDLGIIGARAEAYNMNGFLKRYVGFPSAKLGLQFNLGRTGFDRLSSVMPVIVPMPFTEAQYNALKDKVAALERENAQLKNKIADLENQLAPFKNLVDGQTYLFQNGRFTAVEAKVASPATVYFDLGSAPTVRRPTSSSSRTASWTTPPSSCSPAPPTSRPAPPRAIRNSPRSVWMPSRPSSRSSAPTATTSRPWPTATPRTSSTPRPRTAAS